MHSRHSYLHDFSWVSYSVQENAFLISRTSGSPVAAGNCSLKLFSSALMLKYQQVVEKIILVKMVEMIWFTLASTFHFSVGSPTAQVHDFPQRLLSCFHFLVSHFIQSHNRRWRRKLLGLSQFSEIGYWDSLPALNLQNSPQLFTSLVIGTPTAQVHDGS